MSKTAPFLLGVIGNSASITARIVLSSTADGTKPFESPAANPQSRRGMKVFRAQNTRSL